MRTGLTFIFPPATLQEDWTYFVHPPSYSAWLNLLLSPHQQQCMRSGLTFISQLSNSACGLDLFLSPNPATMQEDWTYFCLCTQQHCMRIEITFVSQPSISAWGLKLLLSPYRQQCKKTGHTFVYAPSNSAWGLDLLLSPNKQQCMSTGLTFISQPSKSAWVLDLLLSLNPVTVHEYWTYLYLPIQQQCMKSYRISGSSLRDTECWRLGGEVEGVCPVSTALCHF